MSGEKTDIESLPSWYLLMKRKFKKFCTKRLIFVNIKFGVNNMHFSNIHVAGSIEILPLVAGC